MIKKKNKKQDKKQNKQDKNQEIREIVIKICEDRREKTLNAFQPTKAEMLEAEEVFVSTLNEKQRALFDDYCSYSEDFADVVKDAYHFHKIDTQDNLREIRLAVKEIDNHLCGLLKDEIFQRKPEIILTKEGFLACLDENQKTLFNAYYQKCTAFGELVHKIMIMNYA